MVFRSNCVRPVYAVYGKDEGDHTVAVTYVHDPNHINTVRSMLFLEYDEVVSTEEFAEGRRMARKDHFRHGRKYVKIKAAGCLEGHGWAYRRGYRDYAVHCCPVRRLIDF